MLPECGLPVDHLYVKRVWVYCRHEDLINAILVECYTLLASRSVHAKLEVRITLQCVQCGTHTHIYVYMYVIYIEKSPVEFTRTSRSARQ